jgi:hypothetical protein
MDENTIWDIRAFVYRHFADTTRPPGVEETSAHFGLTRAEAAYAYEELNRRHALYLKPGTHEILMAFPFSGIGGRTYFANCAWDSLGIPAALRADAEIEAKCAQTGESIRLKVRDQQVQDSDVLVHFLVPFREWYNDLPST